VETPVTSREQNNVLQHLEKAQCDAQQFADWLRSALAGPHDLAARAELKKALRRTRVTLALLASVLAVGGFWKNVHSAATTFRERRFSNND
jgi:hypothetical protein